MVDGDRMTATLRRPARGVAAGQALVAYRPDPAGDIVLGSATIASAHRVGPSRRTAELMTATTNEGGWPWAAGAATGVGSLPGTDIVEAVKLRLR